MTDHYALAIDALETAEVYRDNLRMEYDAVRHKDPVAIARTRDDLRHVLTVAKLQTNLAAVQQARAQVQALEDLRGEIALLFQDLNAPRCQDDDPGQFRLLTIDGGAQRGEPEARCTACVQDHRPTCTHRDLAEADR